MVRRTIWDALHNRMGDRDFTMPYFDNCNKEIIDAFPSGGLLVYQVKEAWEPMCEFLEGSVPDTDPPGTNSRDETKELLEELTAASGEALSEETMAASILQITQEE